MCGIFGLIDNNGHIVKSKKNFLDISKQFFIQNSVRGRDSAGITLIQDQRLSSFKFPIDPKLFLNFKKTKDFLNEIDFLKFRGFLGQCRLVTNGPKYDNQSNQPIILKNIIGYHNGIVLDFTQENFIEGINNENDTKKLFSSLNEKINNKQSTEQYLNSLNGTISISYINNLNNSINLYTNNGSIYYFLDKEKKILVYASEKFILFNLLKKDLKIKSFEIKKLQNDKLLSYFLDSLKNVEENILTTSKTLKIEDYHEINQKKIDLIKKCSKCILPETFPFIFFDNRGVCNFCNSHKKKTLKGETELEKIFENHNSKNRTYLLGLSGGKDSMYGLHLLKKKYNLKVIAMTYDWGLTSDIARKNISLICSKLKIEHIFRSANIKSKRNFIRKNLYAWMRRPNLGMVPLFFAGDKEFLYYLRKVKLETNSLESIICSGNQLEEMEFKLGYCGVNQNLYGNQEMYNYSLSNIFKLLFFYSKNYFLNTHYFNESMLDNIKAFYYSFFYNHNSLRIYDYIKWDQSEITKTLDQEYNIFKHESFGDTQWRMGDNQTSFTNFIYYTLGGFSEFDNYRSKQIRNGEITRSEALKLAKKENSLDLKIKAIENFCNLIGVNTEEILIEINKMPKLY